jgi:hypothetical protein
VSVLAQRPRKLQCAFPVLKLAFELSLFYGSQYFLESRPGYETHTFEIIACHKPRRIYFFNWSFQKKALDEAIGIEPAMAGETVKSVEFHVFLESRQAYEPL